MIGSVLKSLGRVTRRDFTKRVTSNNGWKEVKEPAMEEVTEGPAKAKSSMAGSCLAYARNKEEMRVFGAK